MLGGCGGSAAVSADDLEELARSTREPLYYAGREFAGLPLTHAARDLFVYGSCEAKSDQGCAPPIQIQYLEFNPAQWRRAARCERWEDVRGVPAAHHDTINLFTGNRVLKIYARSDDENMRVARALRPIGGRPGTPLERPSPALRRAVDEACGSLG